MNALCLEKICPNCLFVLWSEFNRVNINWVAGRSRRQSHNPLADSSQQGMVERLVCITAILNNRWKFASHMNLPAS